MKISRSLKISLVVFVVLCAFSYYGKVHMESLPHPDNDQEVVVNAMTFPVAILISAVESLIIYGGLRLIGRIKNLASKNKS